MNYPIKKTKNFKQKIGHKNRGISLEEDINLTNEYYLSIKRASIYKKPTPIHLVKVSKDVITKAYFETPSTTDYNGIYRGKYIDFEAKETKGESFPLSNIRTHQLHHLKTIYEMGGIGFIIIRFSKFDETFLLDVKDLLKYIEISERKSIPYQYFCENGYKISVNFNPRLDYLKIVDEVYFKGVNNERYS